MMRPILRLAALAAVLLAPLAGFAGSSLVLSDGQVIKGTEIKRDGDSYLVTLADGNVAVFPSSLVKEIKFDDDPAPTPPPGLVYAKPEQLAGPVIPPSTQDPNDQMKVLGPPTQWSKSAVDTTWVPTNAYDPNADVMAGSKSTWSKNAVDTTWKPQDGFGFKNLSFKGAVEQPPEFAAALPPASPYVDRPAAAPQGPAPWTCAEKIFVKDTDKPATDKENRAASLTVHPVKSPLYASLGLPLYEAQAGSGDNSRKAVFTIAGGACRLVGGDSDAILGLNLTPDHAMTQDGAAFNSAMATRGGAKVPPGVDKLDYALALVSLTDPLVSGVRAATLMLIAKPEDLRTIAAKSPTSCTLSKGKRRKQEREANAAFAIPRIAAGKVGDVVTFLSWSSAGGIVYRNTVVLSRGGVVSADRSIVASHIGAHTD